MGNATANDEMHPVGSSSIYAVIHECGGSPYFLTENNMFSANVSNAVLMWRREAYTAREATNLMLEEQGHPLAGKLKVVSLWYREEPDEEE